ncbi:hypothetical protein N656DRAFT_848806 [Canariomyces notabilis]|uniref:Uncharacterized protein n=1 Tax=Canariomyces notabilis TaxID=2074819 RepID=A0AAN6T8V8_9PEZI|nr:hypothetical protein N656DRAFT_848806 [Canariomyces arenarius]
MAWGKDKSLDQQQSRLKQLLPLAIALLICSAIAWVLYQVFVSLSKVRDQARERIRQRHSVSFSKDGVRIDVRDRGSETYMDATQSLFVKAWYLGRDDPDGEGAEQRKRSPANHG